MPCATGFSFLCFVLRVRLVWSKGVRVRLMSFARTPRIRIDVRRFALSLCDIDLCRCADVLQSHVEQSRDLG